MNDWNYENEQWTVLPTHLKHLPLFTRHFDFTSYIFRVLWAIFLKFAFRYYIRLKVKGDFKKMYKNHPRLLLISNHASHLDAVSIAAAIPFRYWLDLYLTAAKDYWFSNPIFTFFSKHCLGAIPIDRKDKKGEAVKLCITLLKKLDRIWMILFPEGTRSKDGNIHTFKRGVSLFALQTKTPILFIYIEGNTTLWPKGHLLPLPGKLTIHVGPIQQPAEISEIDTNYRNWVMSINPDAYKDLPKEIEKDLLEENEMD
ncbi:MAG: 1-acyl-sn-glycerol-3-phosphate acyltransferase [Bdellovibrionales bacterium]|nr:1-acyl-sn-glycerol-3-phosphate acyltransferase [Bdellovibrionales bacterium]